MTKFVLIGGFLGAGKTTLIGRLAESYIAAGKRVGIITNDQAADLVDTQNLRSQGFSVGEVSGACFCCSFDELVSTAHSLAEKDPPDVLLAEPVGSCTDLVATVILPLRQLFGESFDLAPFGVLLKPSHGERILGASSHDRGKTKRSGFSPQAEYIFRKQLEEADYVMVGRADQVSAEQQETLRRALSELAPDVPVVTVSPKTGEGLDSVLGYIESPMIAGRRLLEIDYDIYADGEAELGWVNLIADLSTEQAVDLDAVARTTVAAIADQINRGGEGVIAHVKASVLGGETQAVANIVNNDAEVDVGLQANRSVSGRLQIIVNARVALDPERLKTHCENSVRLAAKEYSSEIHSISAHSLRPGRPEPTHRMTQGSDA